MAYVHEASGLAWLAHPRTGSQATAAALMRQAGFVAVSADGERETTERLPGWHHDGLPPGREVRSVATTVRHHGAAVASWWEYRHRKPAWRELVREGLHADHAGYWPERRRLWALHADAADRLLRHERLQAELNAWLADGGLGPVRLERRNASERRLHEGWRAYYAPEDWEALRALYGDEMRELGYGWRLDRGTRAV